MAGTEYFASMGSSTNPFDSLSAPLPCVLGPFHAFMSLATALPSPGIWRLVVGGLFSLRPLLTAAKAT
jgi:hypothetical protein